MSRIPTTHLPIRGSALLTGAGTSPSTSLPSSSFNFAPRIHRLTQVRHATLIKRPQRPYTFTQLIQLSDGSTFTVRTTSPLAMYKSAKDTRNHARWQPSDKSLRNVEVDEAGKLAAFRERYGRGWDLDEDAAAAAADAAASAAAVAAKKKPTGAAADAKSSGSSSGSKRKRAGAAADDAAALELAAAAEARAKKAAEEKAGGYGSLIDLIGGYAEEAGMKAPGGSGLSAKEMAKQEKKKKGKK